MASCLGNYRDRVLLVKNAQSLARSTVSVPTYDAADPCDWRLRGTAKPTVTTTTTIITAKAMVILGDPWVNLLNEFWNELRPEC
jgi:hypothetical protein